MVLLLIILLLTAQLIQPVYAQETGVSIEEAKAHYFIQTLKHVSNTDVINSSTLDILYVGKQGRLYTALKQAVSIELVRRKKLVLHNTVSRFEGNKQPGVIFVAADEISENQALFGRYPQALIVTDGKVSESFQLISLLEKRSQVEIKLNRQNIVDRGYTISTGLLKFAGTEADIVQELIEKEKQLNLLEDKYLAQQLKLKTLNSETEALRKELAIDIEMLQSTNEQLEEKSSALKQSQEQLKVLKDRIYDSEVLINKSQQELNKNQSLLSMRTSELVSKENDLKVLSERVKQKADELEKKSNALIALNKETSNMSQLISKQRNWLFFIVFLGLVIIFLSLFVLRVSVQRKQAIAELAKTNTKLYELATTDGMTGLNNRRHFLEAVEKYFPQASRLNFPSAMILADIDHFKQINDTYGHTVGDEAIIATANALNENTRDQDFLCRFGGEEFAVYLVNTDRNQAIEIAERIRQEIEALVLKIDNHEFQMTISIGIAFVSPEKPNLDDIIARADEALYEAKSQGRNSVVTEKVVNIAEG